MSSSFAKLDLTTITDATVLLDIDGTLASDHSELIESATRYLVESLKRHNTVYLASNGTLERTERLAAELGVLALPRLRKPLPSRALHDLERRSRTIVIGDKFMTDGLFAMAIGAEFIRVAHVRSDTDKFLARVLYAVDCPIAALAPYALLVRPWQWIKNLLVFAPIFFAGSILLPERFSAAVAAFVGFCFVAGAVYAFNDLFDVAQDRLHPTKRLRPLASGLASTHGAKVLIVFMTAGASALCVAYPALALPLAAYAVLNIAYTSVLKHLAIIDILCVAVFYLLRLLAGSATAAVPLSPWIILCTFFVALFIVLGKRRVEYRHDSHRKVLEEYSRETLDIMLAATAALVVISYGLYSILGHTSSLLEYSTIFVVLAVFRVLNHISTRPDYAESPERLLLKDPWIFGSFLLWGLYLFFIFYFAR